ncbi:MAG: nuclear transport factor 2 family protein [Betaproteobacteria bacterium]
MIEPHPNAALIERFYAAFARRDGATMATCYAPDAHFTDPVFDLEGAQVGAMWSMLCERGTDLKLAWRDVRADDTTGSAHWEPRYTFSATGRPVHNVIDATFTFAEGRIVRHVDSFDLWRWSRMALGLKGTLLGGTPIVRNAIRAQAKRGLDAWMNKPPRGAPAL